MKFRIETTTLRGLLIHVSIVLGLFSLLSFTVFYKVLPLVTNKDQIVTVPNLIGMSVDEAIEFVKDKDLEIEVIDSSYNAELAPTLVLEQFPKPNSKVKINRKINLKLNARIPPTVNYPDLAGSTFDFAQKQLKNLNLKIGTIRYQPDIANNAILESRLNGKKISAGHHVTKGSKIDLVIGTYNEKFALPDFENMPMDEVEAYILGMNLKVKKINYLIGYNDEQIGTVKKQQPNAGDTVRLGDEVEMSQRSNHT
jgi:eukaryotic-like serine/threonine-protein kinase